MRRGYPARMGLLWIVRKRAFAMNVLFFIRLAHFYVKHA